MTTMTQSILETITIDFQLVDDGTGFPMEDRRNALWFRFRAIANSTNGSYLVARSERVPLGNWNNAPVAPQKGNVAHENMFRQLIERLQKDGWEVVPALSGSNWWETAMQRFTENTMQKPSSFGTWLGVALAAIAVIALGLALYNMIPDRLYSASVTPLAERRLTVSAETPQLTGSVLLVNADRNRVDPLHAELSTTFAATTVEEATSAVWIDCNTEPIGTQNGIRVVSNCLLTAVNLAAGIQYEPVEIAGSEQTNPQVSSGVDGVSYTQAGTDVYEIRDEEAILSFVNSIHQ